MQALNETAYTFKVRLNCSKKFFWQIDLTGKAALGELHKILQQQCGFNKDYIYPFHLRSAGIFGGGKSVGADSKNVKLKDMKLKPGATFKYRFGEVCLTGIGNQS